MNEEKLSEEYVNNYGTHCPVCGSDNIAVNDLPMSFREGTLQQRMLCLDCDSDWEEYYELARIDDICKGGDE